jgi:site-specific recombinase XerD
MLETIRSEPENRSPITMPGYRKGQHPANYGLSLPAEVLTRDEIERLLRTLGQGPCGLRNRALIVLMWRSGLRIAEALSLHPKDVDRRAGTVTVLRGKRGKRRQVGVDAYALAVLEQWLAARAQLGLTGRAPVFCCVDIRTRGKAMYSSYVRDMLKQRAAQAGIQKRVHPHGLRHTMAFELIMEGQPLGVIRDQLGHSQLGTTLRYCDHLAAGTAIKAMHDRPLPEPLGDRRTAAESPPS